MFCNKKKLFDVLLCFNKFYAWFGSCQPSKDKAIFPSLLFKDILIRIRQIYNSAVRKTLKANRISERKSFSFGGKSSERLLYIINLNLETRVKNKRTFETCLNLEFQYIYGNTCLRGYLPKVLGIFGLIYVFYVWIIEPYLIFF